MSYDIHQEKNYSHSQNIVFAAALKSIEKLSGKILSSQPDEFKVEVKFDKTLLGKVLGDRTQLTCIVQIDGDRSKTIVDAYPLDAVGRKLMFGARKGVTQTVVDLFSEHLETNL